LPAVSERLFDEGAAVGQDAEVAAGGAPAAGDRGRAGDAGAAPPGQADAPLAARLRPASLDEVVGQATLVGQGAPLRAAVEADRLTSAILWGPPGTGKTTLAHVIAEATSSAFVAVSAVTAGVKDLRAAVEAARQRRAHTERGTVLFVDEIHRFSAAQQDALLPAVEDGSVVLIGATTQNPMVEVNAPLLSRSLLYRLDALGDGDVAALVDRAVTDERGLPGTTVTDEAAQALVAAADGDARAALTALEAAAAIAGDRAVTAADVSAALARPRLRYDRAGDAHYDQASAFIKSLRGSDPDAGVYWLVRMLAAGEDPKFLARRMVILAGEDIGLADPQALPVATAAFAALERVGLPEARYNLAQAAIYLALAPKSNAVTQALAAADAAVERLGNADVPHHLRDTHYRGAAALGHHGPVGSDSANAPTPQAAYAYPHDDPRGWVAQRYLPEGLEPGDIWQPRGRGAELALQAWRDSRPCAPEDEP
jgi:putative ATPase